MDASAIDLNEVRPFSGLGHPMGIETPTTSAPMALTTAWSAIHEAATTVGVIAGLDIGHLSRMIDRGLEVSVGPCVDAALREDMQDLTDVLQRGITALLYAHTSGGSPDAAARALWAEFLVARDAISTRLV